MYQLTLRHHVAHSPIYRHSNIICRSEASDSRRSRSLFNTYNFTLACSQRHHVCICDYQHNYTHCSHHTSTHSSLPRSLMRAVNRLTAIARTFSSSSNTMSQAPQIRKISPLPANEAKWTELKKIEVRRSHLHHQTIAKSTNT